MPVPWSVGDHVALDVFQMLRVRSEGIHYDGFILAVDVLSSYTMAFPVTMSGLTGAKAAKKMFSEWVRMFGMPSLVTTDDGPQFLVPGGKPSAPCLASGGRTRMRTTTRPTGKRKGQAKSSRTG